jgi:hypothetical protein
MIFAAITSMEEEFDAKSIPSGALQMLPVHIVPGIYTRQESGATSTYHYLCS